MLFDSLQPHEFAFNINGAVFAAPNYQIEAVNNSSISDFPLASRIDSLTVGAGGLQAANPADFPNLDPSRSGFRMTLYAPDSVLAQASVPSGVGIWNSFFLWRSIEVSFGDGVGHVGFQAFVGPFVEVPEPTNFAMTWFAIFALLRPSRVISCKKSDCRR